ncbi:MAG: YceI family protein [Actinomycetota bacterium]|jgi:polyisoprenoid-binding protein YceI|nr:YceI family protein [Actinomycetota bacterium]
MELNRWVIDPAYSAITFRIPHLTVTKVRGRFNSFSGRLLIRDDNYSDAVVEIRIDSASLDTNEKIRDHEARSKSFLDVKQFPDIIFRSTDMITVRDDGVTVAGDVSIHGVTRAVDLNVALIGRTKDLEGCERMSWESQFRIRRGDFGLLWHPALENAAGFILADEIDVTCEFEFLREECLEQRAVPTRARRAT